MLFRTTEHVGEPELSYKGYMGFGVMQGLGARLAMFDRYGWHKSVVHNLPTGTPPFTQRHSTCGV